MGENYNANFDEKRPNRPSGICLLGVPPYNAYKNSKNIDKELGYHPLLSTKTPKVENKLCFYGRKLKREVC